MQPWFKIVKPYPFIESLGKREDLLVADLGDVLTGVAHPIYLDPSLFVKTTHFTHGLIQFLSSILNKISTGDGNSVIRLQAQFGGGKTHSLIAAHHLLTHEKIFTDVLSAKPLNLTPIIVSLIGTHLNPLMGRQVNNIQIYTPWGELAYQLKGVDGYEFLRDNDQRRISPGKTTLFSLLSSSEPVVILLDEITEFITKARGVKVNDSNLGLQTLIFLQELTECIRSLNKSILIISLPDREYEVTRADDKPLLVEIDHILGRLASSAIPSERTDLYHIIQKKLIAEILDHDSLDRILDEFTQIYSENKKSFPAHTTMKSYHSVMKSAYPFHPEIIDVLIDKWKNISSFQGTRSLLSILSSILADLKAQKSDISIINLSDIDLSNNSLSLLFSRYLPSNLTEILNYEFSRLENPIYLKKPTGNWERLGKMIISIIFLNSNPSSKTQGALPQDINLGIWKPNIDLALVSEVFDSLSHDLEFFHKRNNRYFISERSNINRKIQELKGEFEGEALQKIKRIFTSQKVDQPISVVVWPKSSEEIPDTPKLKLVLFSPHMEELEIDTWINFKGDRFRKYQNTILFSQPNVQYLDRLISTYQEQMSIYRILETEDKTLLYTEDRQKLKSKLLMLKNSVGYILNRIYLDFTDSLHNYSLIPPKVLETSSVKWIIQDLIENEVLVKKVRPAFIKENFLIEKRKIDTRSLLDQFLKNLAMPKLLNTQILKESLVEGVKEQIFSYEDNSDNIKYSNAAQHILNPADINFTETELIERSISPQNHSSKTDSLQKDRIREKGNTGISLEFHNLSWIELESVWKGIIVPLESEKGELQLGLTINIENSDQLENKMTMLLIKETASQVGGKIKEISRIK